MNEMGYTHYWEQPKELDIKKFTEASADCKKICEAIKAPIQMESDDSSPPVFSEKQILFNGVLAEGHETFLFSRSRGVLPQDYPSRDVSGNLYFSFCKTASKPYDLAVCCCLIVLKHHFGDTIRVSSDGGDVDWHPAVEACQQQLGYGSLPFASEVRS